MTIKAVKFEETFSRNVKAPRQLLETTDYKVGMTMATLIRMCKEKDPKTSNGEIARFLTEFTGKFVRPQWVFNVLNNPPKGK